MVQSVDTKKDEPKCLTSYRFLEARTANGDILDIECDADALEEIRELLAQKVRRITIPTDHKVNVGHGGYGMYSRYEVVQHKYAGGGWGECGGFIEVLEIKNPPEGRCGIVIHEYHGSYGHKFSEWKTLQQAIKAWKNNWGSCDIEEKLEKLPGFIRYVHCAALCPWFYAIGNEELIGDYCFPYGLQDDPVFRFGRKFVVEENGVKSVKTCMGTRFFEREVHERYGMYQSWQRKEKVERYRWVYWDDGTIWKENWGSEVPRPLDEKEHWIVEAIRRFKELLSGNRKEFRIEFIDGSQFVGKWVAPGKKNPCAEGSYLVVVTFSNGKTREGWVDDFVPSEEYPDVIQMVRGKMANSDKIESIEIKASRVKPNGKKWKGVFFKPSER